MTVVSLQVSMVIGNQLNSNLADSSSERSSCLLAAITSYVLIVERDDAFLKVERPAIQFLLYDFLLEIDEQDFQSSSLKKCLNLW